MSKPQEGKVYRLTGDGTTPSIANGNTWEESEVEEYYDDPVDLYGGEWENHAVREWD